MFTENTLNEAKQFRKEMLITGIITLPFLIGFIFLGIYLNMDELIKNYEKTN